MSQDLTVSIVAYKNDSAMVERAISSCLNSELNIRLFLVDNSPTDVLRSICGDERIEYIHNDRNLGFGAGHNVALRACMSLSRYHLVLNPDVYFPPGVLEELFFFLQKHPKVGMVMPKVLYPDGSTQYLCKKLPTPFDPFSRRFLPFLVRKLLDKRMQSYDLRNKDYDNLLSVPYLSGCFMMIRTAVLKEVGLFDERIFMYGEDCDLTRRIHQKFETIYYPYVSIYHLYEKGSYKRFRLLFENIKGMAVYFNKWGWFSDKERALVNKKVTEQSSSELLRRFELL